MEIDIARHIGAAVREVRSGMRDGVPVRSVIAGRIYGTTAEDLWDAITSPERIPRWLTPISGDLREGGRYQLEGNAGGVISRCEPPRHLSVTWEIGGGVSWVEARISAKDAGAYLELQHTVTLDAHWERFGAGAVGVGWDLSLLGLALHLEEGGRGPVDRSDAMRWMGSPQGADFMRRSSDAWARASIGSGIAEDEAMAQAARTITAYTGAGPEGG